MDNIIIILIVVAIIGLAVFYICKEKKKGKGCIGCPMSGSCPHKGRCGSTIKINKE